MKIHVVSENLRPTLKKLKAELLKGKESDAQLQILLHKSVEGHHELVPIRELALQISTSLTNSLSHLSSYSELAESAQIAAVDNGEGGGSASNSDERELGEKSTAAVKDRRGCHKRRRGSVSWIKVSPTAEDGCAWRKYGQKQIMNTKYPRCYFRCTYKSQGCKALKQVQKMEEDPHLHHITYFNQHTCKVTPELGPQHYSIPDHDSHLLGLKQEHSANPTNISSISNEDFSDAKSALDPWLMYKTVWSSPSAARGREDDIFGLHSSESASFQGLDMEVNQFDDLDNLLIFD